MPFAQVPELVGARRVYLRAGVAYVAQEQVYALVVGAFRAHLSAALAEAARCWGAFAAAEGGRLAPLVESMPSRSFAGGDGRKAPAGELTAAGVHQAAAARRLPPCMALMYERLAGERHLKHYGLQQMSLFLKHVGLPLEQALLFWRAMFAPRCVFVAFCFVFVFALCFGRVWSLALQTPSHQTHTNHDQPTNRPTNAAPARPPTSSTASTRTTSATTTRRRASAPTGQSGRACA